jgi:hypothetical protein
MFGWGIGKTHTKNTFHEIQHLVDFSKIPMKQAITGIS